MTLTVVDHQQCVLSDSKQRVPYRPAISAPCKTRSPDKPYGTWMHGASRGGGSGRRDRNRGRRTRRHGTTAGGGWRGQAAQAEDDRYTLLTNKVATRCAEGLHTRSCAVRRKPRPDAVGRDFRVRPTAWGRDETRGNRVMSQDVAQGRHDENRATVAGRSGGGGEVVGPLLHERAAACGSGALP